MKGRSEIMIHITDELKNKIKEANDLIEIAEEYFPLTKLGNIYQTKCTHKGDNSPSLTFFPDTQSFYCFGCGAGSKQKSGGSDVISFIQWIENCSWQEAVFKLCDRKGIAIPTAELSKEEKIKQKLLEVTYQHNKIYWRNLKTSPKIVEYFSSRGFDKEDIDKWRLGYVLQTDPTKAAGRAVFAIMNTFGQTAGFSFRNMNDVLPMDPLDTGPKYFNSPTGPVFDKGKILYGLNFIKRLIREKDYIIIMEGFGDTIIGQKFGLPAVSIMGTSLTKDHIELIGRYTKNVIVWMDGDSGGVGAALRHLDPLREQGYLVKVIHTPGQDPDDVIRTMPDIEHWVRENAVMAGHFELSIAMDKYLSQVAELRLKTVREMIPVFQRMKNKLEYELYVGQISTELGIHHDVLLSYVKEVIESES